MKIAEVTLRELLGKDVKQTNLVHILSNNESIGLAFPAKVSDEKGSPMVLASIENGKLRVSLSAPGEPSIEFDLDEEKNGWRRLERK